MSGLVQRFSAAIMLSLFLALLLSFVPLLQEETNHPSVPVFSAEKSANVYGNLVDQAVSYQAVQFQKIDWRDKKLLLEVRQTPGITENRLIEECYALIKGYFAYSYVETISLIVHTDQWIPPFQIKATRMQLAADPSMNNHRRQSLKQYLQEMFTWIPLKH